MFHAKYVLSTCLRQENKSIDQYLQVLNRLAADCCFRDVTATTYRDESVRDAFIRGIRSSVIHARLLENDALNLQETTQCATALEQAYFHAESYASQIGPAAAATTMTKNVFADSADTVAATTITKDVLTDSADPRMECAALPTHERCYNCGGKLHAKDDHSHCLDCNKIFWNCGKLGHFAKVCHSTKPTPSHSTLAFIVAHVKDGDRSPPITKIVKLKGKRLTVLIDRGSSDNFISVHIVKTMNLSTLKWYSVISVASSAISLKLSEYCTENIIFNS